MSKVEWPKAAPAPLIDRPVGLSPLKLSEEDLAAFVGPNSAIYVDYLWRCQAAGELKSGFIWSGFFFTAFWLAYRRFYAGIFGYIAISILPLMSIVGGVYVAMRGRAMVLRRARDAVYIANARGLAGAERHAFLAKAGKPSWVAVTVTFIVSLFFAVIALGLVANQAAEERAARENAPAVTESVR